MSAIPIITPPKERSSTIEIGSILNIFKLAKTNDSLHTQSLASLLEKGQVNPNIKEDGTGKTLLMYACEKGDTTIASSLINVRADPNIQDLNGRTALFYAMSCITDNRNTISVLLQSSMLLIIDIDSTISCKDGSTAIVWGIEKGSIENVRMLLTKHPKLLGFSYNGNNLLHIAICSKRLEIVKLLLEEFKNINFNALNYSGINPIDLSVQAGGEIARYVANELEENKLNKRANKNKYTKRMLLNNTGSSKDAAIFNLNPTREELNFTAEDKMISFATTEYQIKIVYT